jgi:hypothetical protein
MAFNVMAEQHILGTHSGRVLHGVNLVENNYLGQLQFKWTNKDADDIVFTAFLFCDRFDDRKRQVVVVSKVSHDYSKHPYWTGTIQVWQAGEGYLYDCNWTAPGEYLINYMMFKYEHYWSAKDHKWVKATPERISNWQKENSNWKPTPGTVSNAAERVLAKTPAMTVTLQTEPPPQVDGKLTFDDDFRPSGSILRGRK